MDPLTVSTVVAVLNRFLGSAASEAGRSAWSGLVGLVRSAFPDRAEVAEAAERLTPGGSPERNAAPGGNSAPDQNAVIDLSAELVGLARGDAGFERALRGWLERAGSVSVEGGVVTNVIGSGATIRGSVVQARDVGPISFGA